MRIRNVRYVMAAVLCVICAVLFSGCAEEKQAVEVSQTEMHGKPSVPADVTWVFDENVRAGEPVEMSLKVAVRSKMDDVKIRISFPGNVEHSAGNLEWSGEMQAGSTKEMTVTLTFPEDRKSRVVGDAVLADARGWKLRRKAVADIDLRLNKPEKAGDASHRHPAVPLEEFMKRRNKKK